MRAREGGGSRNEEIRWEKLVRVVRVHLPAAAAAVAQLAIQTREITRVIERILSSSSSSPSINSGARAADRDEEKKTNFLVGGAKRDDGWRCVVYFFLSLLFVLCSRASSICLQL